MNLKTKNKATKIQLNHTKKAYIGIRQMLFHGEIAPGQKLSYRDLSERLGMSPTPVIHALKWLEVEKLVRHELNRGYYTEPLSLQQLKEIYDLRHLIELSLLPTTIGRLTSKKIKQLESALETYIASQKDQYINEWLRTDMEFHLLLASFSKRQTHLEMLRHLFDLFYLKYTGSIYFSPAMNLRVSGLENVFNAVAAKDLEKAQKALSDHIVESKRHVTESLNKVIEYRNKKRRSANRLSN